MSWHLSAKGGLPREEVEASIIQFARSCKPPFSAQDALRKVESAFDRLKNRERNLTQEMREWIEQSTDVFQNRDIITELDIPRDKKGQVSVYLARFYEEKLIRKVRGGYGHWRRIERDIIPLDFNEAENDTLSGFVLPLGTHNLTRTRPGDIIINTGNTNAGKTAFNINFIANNMDKFEIHYFNSEMSAGELRERLELLKDVPFSSWNFKAYSRDRDFEDVIVPGKGVINIIDYIELHENFYQISGIISNIWNELNGAIGLITLQKNPGVKVAKGGWGSAEKARLYLSMEHNSIEIVKAKNWATKRNPNGLKRDFKLVNGCTFISQNEWHR